jgi:hypothetical protein
VNVPADCDGFSVNQLDVAGSGVVTNYVPDPVAAASWESASVDALEGDL